jgi:NOL1/NOP2/sun family putative RNA methylase
MNTFIKRYIEIREDFKFDKCPNLEGVRDVLRVNTLKIDNKKLFKRLKDLDIKLKKVDFLPHAYKYKSKFSLASTSEYAQGYLYLQEAASQIPVLVLDPKPGEIILDMCAAPGSKTTYMSQLMENKGIVVALDNNSSRLNGLKSNLLRCGCKNTILYKKDARFAFDFGKKFDKILLDAPCSGNFVIEPKFFVMRSVQAFLERARLQKELLRAAYKCLNPGGILVYSTCSLEPEENERVVDWFINKHKDMKLQKINIDIPNSSEGLTSAFGNDFSSELKKCIRIWPDKAKMQGFFVAKLVKE